MSSYNTRRLFPSLHLSLVRYLVRRVTAIQEVVAEEGGVIIEAAVVVVVEVTRVHVGQCFHEVVCTQINPLNRCTLISTCLYYSNMSAGRPTMIEVATAIHSTADTEMLAVMTAIMIVILDTMIAMDDTTITIVNDTMTTILVDEVAHHKPLTRTTIVGTTERLEGMFLQSADLFTDMWLFFISYRDSYRDPYRDYDREYSNYSR